MPNLKAELFVVVAVVFSAIERSNRDWRRRDACSARGASVDSRRVTHFERARRAVGKQGEVKEARSLVVRGDRDILFPCFIFTY